MSGFKDLSHDDQIARVTVLAERLCKNYFAEVSSIELINFEFNATFRVRSGPNQYALRLNINSLRTEENIRAEVAFIDFLGRTKSVKVPQPVPAISGEFIVTATMDSLDRPINSVMYSWLQGSEVGDDPSGEQLFALGATMAQMHKAVANFELPERATLPEFDDFFWRTEDFLFSTYSKLAENQKRTLNQARQAIEAISRRFFARDLKIVIHADLHGWNLMWDAGAIAIFDFDDSGIGLPIQDLATALYYLDTDEQDIALLDGYRSVAPIPEYSEIEMEALLLQRRMLLLNYLYETSNREHQELLPKYLEETMKRASNFLIKIRK